MTKRAFFAITVAGVVVVMALLLQNHPTSEQSTPPAIATATEAPSSPQRVAPPTSSATESDAFKRQILDLMRHHQSPEEAAALLKALYREDPEHLFAVFLSLEKEPLETRQLLLPLLAKALTLCPEAEGRYIFPIADSYGDMDLPAAAGWAATFLATTGRDDLAAATLVGRLVGTSENEALALIATLPEASRKEAVNSAVNHISLNDLNHLMDVCGQLDPGGSTSFSQQLFQRLAMERLDDAAAWLASTPAAERVPGAAAAIAQGLVLGGDPQKAITWADSLSEETARGQAIAAVYQQWARNAPQSAIQDILNSYGGDPQVMADVFKGAADQHGSGATTYWNTACNIENPSARAYAVGALIEPMLLSSGLAETQARIAALPPDSLERNVADLMIQADIQKPTVAQHLQNSQEQ